MDEPVTHVLTQYEDAWVAGAVVHVPAAQSTQLPPALDHVPALHAVHVDPVRKKPAEQVAQTVADEQEKQPEPQLAVQR